MEDKLFLPSLAPRLPSCQQPRPGRSDGSGTSSTVYYLRLPCRGRGSTQRLTMRLEAECFNDDDWRMTSTLHNRLSRSP